MRANLTTRDYEQLSAYIDGQLAPGEQRKLEERLRARPELQVALDEMQRTRALLRQAPRRRAPRNFTLTPAMVGEQRRKPAPWAGWFPALSFTSALAALALVVTIALQFAPPGSTSQTIAMQPPAEMQEMPAAEAPSAESPMMKKMEEPAAGAAEPEAADPFSLQAPETERALEATDAAGDAVLPEYEATAQAFGEATPDPNAPSTAMAAPEEKQPPAESPAATVPPVITWDNSGAGVPPQANGMGGGPGGAPPGMGGGMGGGADDPSLGPLMGPPPAPDSTSGLGGGAPDGAAPETMAIQDTPAPGAPSATQEPPAAEDAPAQPQGTPIAAVPADPAANSTGPILGVPEAGEGGQITDKKAILGAADGMRSAAPAGAPAQPEAGSEIARDSQAQQRGPFGLPLWALTALQVALALLAVAAGVAAYLLRIQKRR